MTKKQAEKKAKQIWGDGGFLMPFLLHDWQDGYPRPKIWTVGKQIKQRDGHYRYRIKGIGLSWESAFADARSRAKTRKG